VAVLHAWRKISEAHVVAPVQLLAHGDGSVHAGAIAHALSKDTLRVRPVHSDPATRRASSRRSGPSVAPTGTFAGDRVLRSTVKLADAPLKVTALAPMNPVPMMVTEERYG
jgi:hypothetical protein